MIKTEKKQFKEVLKAFYVISRLFESIHNGQYHNNIYNMYLSSEKNFRKYKPCGVISGMSIQEGSIFLYIHDLIRIVKGKIFLKELKQVLYIKPEYVLLLSLYLNYENEIKEALKDIDIDLIYNMDYATLQNNN